MELTITKQLSRLLDEFIVLSRSQVAENDKFIHRVDRITAMYDADKTSITVEEMEWFYIFSNLSAVVVSDIHRLAFAIRNTLELCKELSVELKFNETELGVLKDIEADDSTRLLTVHDENGTRFVSPDVEDILKRKFASIFSEKFVEETIEGLRAYRTKTIEQQSPHRPQKPDGK